MAFGCSLSPCYLTNCYEQRLLNPCTHKHKLYSRMNYLEITLLCFAAFVVGSLGGLAIHRRTNDQEIQMGEQLMEAVNKARMDVLGAFKMIDEMERVNLVLRTENHTLKVENLDLKTTAKELREQLNDALDNIFILQEEVKKYFPNTSHAPKPERDSTNNLKT